MRNTDGESSGEMGPKKGPSEILEMKVLTIEKKSKWVNHLQIVGPLFPRKSKCSIRHTEDSLVALKTGSI